ncbi:MAG: ATP-binding protein [Thermoleophilia bacterium]
MQGGRELEVSARASPASLRPLREVAAGWLLAEGVDADRCDEIVLALSEAAANAIEHPREPQRPTVEIRMWVDADVVHVQVVDSGRWRERVDGQTGTIGRGRGLMLLRSLADDVRIRRGPSGTTVEFVCDVRASPA